MFLQATSARKMKMSSESKHDLHFYLKLSQRQGRQQALKSFQQSEIASKKFLLFLLHFHNFPQFIGALALHLAQSIPPSSSELENVNNIGKFVAIDSKLFFSFLRRIFCRYLSEMKSILFVYLPSLSVPDEKGIHRKCFSSF